MINRRYKINKNIIDLSENKMNIRIQQKRDTSNNWKLNNPILLEGELGIELDTNKIKIGNGRDNWNKLEYIGGNNGGGVNVEFATKDELNDSSIKDKALSPFSISSLINKVNKQTQRIKNLEAIVLSGDSPTTSSELIEAMKKSSMIKLIGKPLIITSTINMSSLPFDSYEIDLNGIDININITNDNAFKCGNKSLTFTNSNEDDEPSKININGSNCRIAYEVKDLTLENIKIENFNNSSVTGALAYGINGKIILNKVKFSNCSIAGRNVLLYADSNTNPYDITIDGCVIDDTNRFGDNILYYNSGNNPVNLSISNSIIHLKSCLMEEYSTIPYDISIDDSTFYTYGQNLYYDRSTYTGDSLNINNCKFIYKGSSQKSDANAYLIRMFDRSDDSLNVGTINNCVYVNQYTTKSSFKDFILNYHQITTNDNCRLVASEEEI